MIEVLIADPENVDDIITWAQTNCKSYVNHILVDVSDHSYTMDMVLAVRFNDEKDSLMFALRWK